MERRRFLRFGAGFLTGGAVGSVFGIYAALSVDRERKEIIIEDPVQLPVTLTPVNLDKVGVDTKTP